MKISVIIPVKNRADLLPITLNNVLDQSKKPYEIIVVDDSSTDGIDGVVERFKQKVIFVASSGHGPGAARNTGLRLATGDAIQFFDSDDLMTNNKLEVQSKLLDIKKTDFVYGPWVKASLEDNKWKQRDVVMQYYSLNGPKMADYVLQGWCNISQTALFRKELIDKAGPWREDLMTHEDYEYWFRLAKASNSFCHENESCVIYRQHQNQITDKAVDNNSRWLDGINAMKAIAEGIDYKPSLNSLWLFKGREALSKAGYAKRFGEQKIIAKNGSDRFYKIYFKLINKLTRVNGTGWQKIHGVNSSTEVFNEYLKLL